MNALSETLVDDARRYGRLVEEQMAASAGACPGYLLDSYNGMRESLAQTLSMLEDTSGALTKIRHRSRPA